MLRFITNFSSERPFWIFTSVLFITAIMLWQIKTGLMFESDISKFLPERTTPGVFANFALKKKFQSQDLLLIGVESKTGSVMEPEALRNIEKITQALKELKSAKTFHSKLTGKIETLSLSPGFDSGNIFSITNLKDVLYDQTNNAIVGGSIVKKLKNDFNIPSVKDGEELLPESDEDIKKIIPGLKKIILKDEMFRGVILSEDLKASAIIAPMIPKRTYKLRRAVMELETALDETKLKDRFQGKDPSFPFSIYGKTIGDIKVDDEYIRRYNARVSRTLKKWLFDFIGDDLQKYPALKEMLEGRITIDKFKSIINYAARKYYFLRWTAFTDDIWEFTLDEIDPFSRENLEFKFADVDKIYDLRPVYNSISQLLEKRGSKKMNFYLGGQPIVVSVFSHLMSEDMRVMGPIAVAVALLILIIGYRSARGVFVPLITVATAIIWVLGLMAVLGVSLSVSTAALPVAMLGVGASYSIHILNRYYEDSLRVKNRRRLIEKSFKYVGRAVVMAGVTTIVGFASLASSGLDLIRDFGVFSAIGVGFVLMLSLTLTPALLAVWRLPAKTSYQFSQKYEQNLTGRTLEKTAVFVIGHPRRIILASLIIFALSFFLMSKNYFEGSMMSMFKKDSHLFKSDQFLNQKLGGVALASFTFNFRPQINLESSKSQAKLRELIQNFIQSWRMIKKESGDRKKTFFPEIVDDLSADSLRPPESLNQIINRIELIKTLLDEEYILDDSEVGTLKELKQRLGQKSGQWQETAKDILKLRETNHSPAGVKMRRQLNRISAFLATDLKQPIVLRKVEELCRFIKSLKQPSVTIDGKEYPPTGMIISPAHFVKKFYKVFYHNDKEGFYRLPDVEKDEFQDRTLSDRDVIGSILNQISNISRDDFAKIVTPDFKSFKIKITARSDSSKFVKEYLDTIFNKINLLFPKDDPYIESVKISGYAPVSHVISGMIGSSQARSIVISFILALIVVSFMFRSFSGGFYSFIPLLFAVVLNFAVIYLLGGKITTGSMMAASITIGVGIDYAIHFLQRLKIQLAAGENLNQAYISVLGTAGKAIVLNAFSVALGFLVLIFSNFVPNIMIGILVAGAMFFSLFGALIILPAIILVTSPSFINPSSTVDDFSGGVA